MESEESEASNSVKNSTETHEQEYKPDDQII